MGFSLLSTGSIMAAEIYNFDSSRFQAAPRDTRTEGWTEAWGSEDMTEDDQKPWQPEEEAIAVHLATPYPQLPLIISQFRPAWLEQMVLRIAKVPHIVVNSAHCNNEATGPLPFLRDHSLTDKPPVLVGRHHPSNIAPPNPICQNFILDYLSTHTQIDLDETLKTDHQRSLSKFLISLIQLELKPCLLYLRYEDRTAWEQVYRRQYLRASSPKSNHWVSHLYGRFQCSMERLHARAHMMEYGRTMNIPRAVERAREAYQALDLHLSKYQNQTQAKMTFLLGNNKPSLADAVLWAHLADALCDVHLVVVLADFPHLVKFFQKLYETYFPARNMEEWDKWNQQQNKDNAFQRLPINDETKLSATGFRDAVELMQKLSLKHHDLQDVLNTTKAKRSLEPWPNPTPTTETLLYRWRMGEDLTKKQQNRKQEEEESPMRKKLIRDQIRNDQAWISGVVGVSAIAILLLQGATAKE